MFQNTVLLSNSYPWQNKAQENGQHLHMCGLLENANVSIKFAYCSLFKQQKLLLCNQPPWLGLHAVLPIHLLRASSRRGSVDVAAPGCHWSCRQGNQSGRQTRWVAG